MTVCEPCVTIPDFSLGTTRLGTSFKSMQANLTTGPYPGNWGPCQPCQPPASLGMYNNKFRYVDASGTPQSLSKF